MFARCMAAELMLPASCGLYMSLLSKCTGLCVHTQMGGKTWRGGQRGGGGRVNGNGDRGRQKEKTTRVLARHMKQLYVHFNFLSRLWTTMCKGD